MIPWIKLAAAVFVFSAMVGNHALAISYSPALIWLAILTPANRQPGFGEVVFRRLLSFVTLVELLQAFPVAGEAQIMVGSLGVILIAVLCLINWAEGVRDLWPERGTAIASFGVAAIGVLTFVQLGNAARTQADRFHRCLPVSFPGCHLTRLPLKHALLYRWLVDNVRNADTFVGKIGYQSLYFWSGRARRQED